MNEENALSYFFSFLAVFIMLGGLATFIIRDMYIELKEDRKRRINMNALFRVFKGVKESYFLKLEREGKKTILVRDIDNNDKYYVYKRHGFIRHYWTLVYETFARTNADQKFNELEGN